MSVEPPAAGAAAAGARPEVDVRRGAERLVTRTPALHAAHSFSFAHHRDPHNTHHGLLVVNNELRLAPGFGVEARQHRNVELVTWVVSGSLVHEDAAGHRRVIDPGLAQRVSAGTGIMHRIRSDPHAQGLEPAHFVQMCVPPDEPDLTPSYEQREIDAQRMRSGLVTIASGMQRHLNDAAVRIANRDAALHGAQLGAGDSVEVPDAPFGHVFVTRGAAELEGFGPLAAGDAARLTHAGARKITATGDAEVLIWEMQSGLKHNHLSSGHQ